MLLKQIFCIISAVVYSSPFFFGGKIGYPGVGGTCGATIAPGTSCIVTLEYNPSVPASSFSGGVILDYFDGLENQSVSSNLQGWTF